MSARGAPPETLLVHESAEPGAQPCFMCLLEHPEEMPAVGKVSSKPFLSHQIQLLSFVRNAFQLG